MTLWDYLPQRHRVPPYWIASMHAGISKKGYKKRAKDAVRQVYTPTEAVRLVLELEMTKKR